MPIDEKVIFDGTDSGSVVNGGVENIKIVNGRIIVQYFGDGVNKPIIDLGSATNIQSSTSDNISVEGTALVVEDASAIGNFGQLYGTIKNLSEEKLSTLTAVTVDPLDGEISQSVNQTKVFCTKDSNNNVVRSIEVRAGSESTNNKGEIVFNSYEDNVTKQVVISPDGIRFYYNGDLTINLENVPKTTEGGD